MALVQTFKVATGAVIFGMMWNPEPVVNAAFATHARALQACTTEIAANIGWWFSFFGMSVVSRFVIGDSNATAKNTIGHRVVYDAEGNLRETVWGVL